MKRIALTLVALLAAGCSRSAPEVHAMPDPALKKACLTENTAPSCISWGRSLLAADESDLKKAQEYRQELTRLHERFPGDETLGILGAYVTKLGGVHAKHGEVIRAVELVDEGLALLQKGLQEKPESRTLRLYYGVTLSRLPSVFHKEQEARDTLQSLRRDPALTEGEGKVVKEALEHLAGGKGS